MVALKTGDTLVIRLMDVDYTYLSWYSDNNFSLIGSSIDSFNNVTLIIKAKALGKGILNFNRYYYIEYPEFFNTNISYSVNPVDSIALNIDSIQYGYYKTISGFDTSFELNFLSMSGETNSLNLLSLFGTYSSETAPFEYDDCQKVTIPSNTTKFSFFHRSMYDTNADIKNKGIQKAFLILRGTKGYDRFIELPMPF